MSGASELISGASEQMNVRASGSALTSRFMAVLNHSATGQFFLTIVFVSYVGMGAWHRIHALPEFSLSHMAPDSSTSPRSDQPSFHHLFTVFCFLVAKRCRFLPERHLSVFFYPYFALLSLFSFFNSVTLPFFLSCLYFFLSCSVFFLLALFFVLSVLCSFLYSSFLF